MKIFQPPRVLAGFHAEEPCEELPELVHLGEQWLPAGRSIDEHEHDTWEFYFQIEGRTAWRVPVGVETLEAGDFLAVAPHVVHGMEEIPGTSHHFFFVALDIRPYFARQPDLALSWPKEESFTLRQAEGLKPAFRQLVREARMDLAFRHIGLQGAIDHLMLECCRALQQLPATALLTLHPAVEEAKRLIETDCTKSWKLADLARLVDLSPNHLANIFKRELGIAPHRYLLQQRVEQAKAILRDTDQSITELARILGFSSSQHFARVFQQFAGCSASAWRAQFRQTVG